MSFTSRVNHLYPIAKMPRWLVVAYGRLGLLCRQMAARCPLWKGFRKRPTLLERLFAKKKAAGFSKYTVITPVYNAEQYLDEYFTSLAEQSLDFAGNIEVIVVDDGSTDGSAGIIKAWAAKYPTAIRYIYQENSGVNAARNAGLCHAANPWVTWVDSDDFIDPDYFLTIDTALEKYRNDNVKMLSCKEVIFDESTHTYADTRPFKRFFTQKERLVALPAFEGVLHFKVSTGVFSLAEIQRQHCTLKEDRRLIHFEDVHFCLRYIADCAEGQCLFLRDARFYYRKRASKDSVVDTMWGRKEFFTDVLREGYLDILHYCLHKHGKVPPFVQLSVLYDLSWKIRALVNRQYPEALPLNEEEKEYFLSLMDNIFQFIDAETVKQYPEMLSRFGDFYKYGVLSCFKKMPEQPGHAFIDKFDHAGRQIRLCFADSTMDKDDTCILVGEKRIAPVFYKITRRTIFSRTFFYQHFLWFALPEGEGEIHLYRKGQKLDILFEDSRRPCATLACARAGQAAARTRTFAANAPWMLMDRDVQADDNAEHMYRYIMHTHPEQTVYFALRKSSKDWERLAKEGFKLVEFGSHDYLKKLYEADAFISSHIDNYIYKLRKDILRDKCIVFLQHGVTKEDISAWVNPKNIDLFITAANAEYTSIAADGTPYVYGSKEVALTGFPRHDRLLQLGAAAQAKGAKTLLIMPTWRKYLAGSVRPGTHERQPLADFAASHYATAWLALLRSERLAGLAGQFGYQVIFFPHVVMQASFRRITLPEHVTLLEHSDRSIQHLFAQAAIMVTDYSSVAFEMCVLERPVLFYQFDEDEYYGGAHVGTRGDFDYRRDGFGPVATDVDPLLDQLETIMREGGVAQPPYRERMAKAFAWRDGGNCARIYSAILSKTGRNGTI